MIRGGELCVFTTPNSTLNDHAPVLMPLLLSNYPTTFVSTIPFIDVKALRVTTVVLLDTTGYPEEFPLRFLVTTLTHHPCYSKPAKFIMLLSRKSFVKKHLAQTFFQKLGILNYILVPVQSEVNASKATTIYTYNQFNKQEHFFLPTPYPVSRFYPDKLRNLNGYKFLIHGYVTYPYIIEFENDVLYGVLQRFINSIIITQRNGTTYLSDEIKLRLAMDCWMNYEQPRKSFMHIFFFRESSGYVVMCPVRTERDFLSHLLKPFSIGIWAVLLAMFVFCRVVQYIFPHIYRYDLIALTFFGGGGTEYLQPFSFRVVMLTLAVLVFFLSEAYNTKIISLMSFSKFYKQPQTLAELAQSNYRILSLQRADNSLFGALEKNMIPYPQTAREERRLGVRVYEEYCTMLETGNARIVVSLGLTNVRTELYILQEPVFSHFDSIQCARDSPFFELIYRSFSYYNDSGLWLYIVKRALDLLGENRSILQKQWQDVIFVFEDLICVWILIVVGWCISLLFLIGELVHFRIVQRRAQRAH
ncbi:uncharacterized protein LOC126576883 [Anopheles aquasalis]|uniref:uncharacterized protein LOC126576883 n=1 Tax=Anopheles aquasalis TaxID=42839 RepID=UPI00215A2167|nr:uncharacterized protein LOC126576883 [Anopheles aquasalis]